uniref:Choline transporter-like protein n=1 Tax=Zooxanthella nutricula TaxID=1333877 RepID=A0A7S2K0L2_9DINO
MNKNAYIQVALCSTSFCTSAKTAFMLIMKNFARFGTMAVLGNIIRFIGMAFIVTATTVLGYFILVLLHPSASPTFPVLIYASTAYVVAKLYMNVYGLASDTALQCFIAVEEQGIDPSIVPSELRSFVDNKGKKQKAAAGKESSVSPE